MLSWLVVASRPGPAQVPCSFSGCGPHESFSCVSLTILPAASRENWYMTTLLVMTTTLSLSWKYSSSNIAELCPAALPDGFQRSEQSPKSSARYTGPCSPPKKNGECSIPAPPPGE